MWYVLSQTVNMLHKQPLGYEVSTLVDFMFHCDIALLLNVKQNNTKFSYIVAMCLKCLNILALV